MKVQDHSCRGDKFFPIRDALRGSFFRERTAVIGILSKSHAFSEYSHESPFQQALIGNRRKKMILWFFRQSSKPGFLDWLFPEDDAMAQFVEKLGAFLFKIHPFQLIHNERTKVKAGFSLR